MGFTVLTGQLLISFYQSCKLCTKILSIVFILMEMNSVYGQDLSLFEETEANSTNSGGEVSRGVRRDNDGNLITGPEFTLIGTARLGDKYVAVLKDRNGEIISISVLEDVNISIPRHPGFQLIDIGSGSVTLKFPDNIPCRDFTTQGVICEESGVAILGLVNGDPLEGMSRATEVISEANRGAVSPDIVSPAESINPFEELLQRASNPDSEISTSSFEPRRIDPEDIPSGMRVVSTPFGDRLVEAE